MTPSTHGDYDSCPVCQYISKNDLYNTNKNEYSQLKRKTSYWANILVVKDPQAPDNEGKVFKYRFGKKIWDKINAMIAVDTEMGETPVDVTWFLVLPLWAVQQLPQLLLQIKLLLTLTILIKTWKPLVLQKLKMTS
ncbi:single stranded DNA-binding protein [Escherichia phage vB_EcoP_EP32B]|nr:single stranded DNA-binding protein [Escherichia phage vB_EcoP_EP32B]